MELAMPLSRRIDVAERSRPTVVRPNHRQEATGLPGGVVGQEAFHDDRTWIGFLRLEPESTSPWHHHGEYDSYIYVISGRIQLDFGPGGREHADAAAEDFIHVPPNVVHREGNPGDTEAHAVLVRVGSGAALVNVAGPDEASG